MMKLRAVLLGMILRPRFKCNMDIGPGVRLDRRGICINIAGWIPVCLAFCIYQIYTFFGIKVYICSVAMNSKYLFYDGYLVK